MAAVSPAGPDPMMMTSRTSSTARPLPRTCLPEEEQAGEGEDSADDDVGRPDAAAGAFGEPAGQVHDDHAQRRDGEQHDGDDAEDEGDEAVDKATSDSGEGDDGLVADGA